MDRQPGTSHRYVISRGQEEKWAADHSRITMILGYCMLAGFLFQIISAAFTDRLQLDILLLFGGCAVLKGSQAWVRFYAFIATCAAIGGLSHIAIAYLGNEPVEHGNRWIDHRDAVFWQDYVASIGVYLGLALLCVAVLRSRQLVFWTKTCKRWVIAIACVVGLIATIAGIGALVGKSKREAEIHRCGSGIKLVRDYALANGTSTSYPAISYTRKAIAEDHTICVAAIHSSPNGSMILYDWNEKGSDADDWDYEEFVRGPSGEWLKITVQFTHP